MKRIVERKLPDGSVRTVFPFHISLEGMESVVLCRDDEDYDVMEKMMFVCSWDNNVLIIIHVVMSNHGHLDVLAPDYESARKTGTDILKRYSQYMSNRYPVKETLHRASVDVQYLDSERYVRNALAYIPGNVLDTGIRIEDYKWSGYRGMFVNGQCRDPRHKVSAMSRRQRESVFHTHSNLADVPWILDTEGHLEPASCCDWQYLEAAFNNDQAFFLKTIGTLNRAEMHQKLVTNPRLWRNDSEFILTVGDIADRWFKKDIDHLSLDQKTRLIPYLRRSYHTSVAQLARCIRLSKTDVKEILRHGCGEKTLEPILKQIDYDENVNANQCGR